MGSVGRRADGQIAPGLGVQQEHEPEYQGQRCFFDPLQLFPVTEISTTLLQPCPQPTSDVGQSFSDESLLKSLAQFFAKVFGFPYPASQPAPFLQRRWCKKAQVESVVLLQLLGVDFQVLPGGRSHWWLPLEQAEATPGCQDTPNGILLLAVSQHHAFGQFSVSR